MYEEIREKLNANNMIVFIGAGVSATLNLPTWGQLIDEMAKELGFDPYVFKELGDYLSLAEYYLLKTHNLDDLQKWMEEHWSIAEDEIQKSEIYNAITSMNCKQIYTTNYDRTLETAFSLKGKPVKRIVTVDDLVNISDEDTQIVKFHGDMGNTQSIVVAESSYFERLNFESPLDIKLRSDMLGKSILFIGYSMSDINIRILLYKLDQLWKRSNATETKPASYIFLATPDPIQEEIFKHRGISPIIGTSLDRSESLKLFLQGLLNSRN